jgi:hypothetical protein
MSVNRARFPFIGALNRRMTIPAPQSGQAPGFGHLLTFPV